MDSYPTQESEKSRDLLVQETYLIARCLSLPEVTVFRIVKSDSKQGGHSFCNSTMWNGAQPLLLTTLLTCKVQSGVTTISCSGASGMCQMCVSVISYSTPLGQITFLREMYDFVLDDKYISCRLVPKDILHFEAH